MAGPGLPFFPVIKGGRATVFGITLFSNIGDQEAGGKGYQGWCCQGCETLPEDFGSHSCKRTTLHWCALAGIDLDTWRLLPCCQAGRVLDGLFRGSSSCSPGHFELGDREVRGGRTEHCMLLQVPPSSGSEPEPRFQVVRRLIGTIARLRRLSVSTCVSECRQVPPARGDG
eukprot:5178716-Amphidinium_carterae.1